MLSAGLRVNTGGHPNTTCAQKTWLHLQHNTACRDTDTVPTVHGLQLDHNVVEHVSHLARCSAGASCVFGAAENALLFVHLPPHRRRIKLLSPTDSLPSSSPMRSSFQVQQSSINLIHSRTPSSRREPAASGRRITGVSDHHRSQPGGRVAVRRSLPVAPHAASSCTFLRRFIQGSLWPMKLPARGEEETGRPTRDSPWLINAFLYRKGGGVRRKKAVRKTAWWVHWLHNDCIIIETFLFPCCLLILSRDETLYFPFIVFETDPDYTLSVSCVELLKTNEVQVRFKGCDLTRAEKRHVAELVKV